MCGIAGILSFEGAPVRVSELQTMCDAMFHRGPDDDGYYLGSGVGLGMRRLSIIDLPTGRQPVANEDSSVSVVFNGEIYNFRELRRNLQARGHVFSTSTDTEVVVHLYEEYGTGFVQHLRGMFGLAIWDQNCRRLLLVRDRLGIKPLYYTESHGRLIFASELKCILALPEIDRKLDWASVDRLFTTSTTSSSSSIVAGIHKLEPAHMLIAGFNQPLVKKRFWSLEFKPDERRSEDDFVHELRHLLDESVRLHMVSDVPLGAFLSGGVDSSTIVASAAQASSTPLRTFSIGFTDQDYDELVYARMAAKQFGTDHLELILEPQVLDSIEDIAWHLDEPFGDSSAIPTYMVSKLAAEHVKVVLSGDGGDELFAGYDRYMQEAAYRSYNVPGFARKPLAAISSSMPEGIKGRRLLRRLSQSGPERYIEMITLLRDEQKTQLFRPEVRDLMPAGDPWVHERKDLEAGGHWLSCLQRCDMNSYLPLDILTKVDRMSMAHSLEARVPLLDHKVVEFAATIPAAMHVRDGKTKHILKRAMRGIVPDPILDRPKRGFAIPLGRWFSGQGSTFVKDLLLNENSHALSVFNAKYIDSLIAKQDDRNLGLPLWTLISFELWCRTFLDRRPGEAPGLLPAAHRREARVVTVTPNKSFSMARGI